MITSTTADTLKIREWKVKKPKAQVFLIHGYAEHTGRYGHLADRLNDEGYHVIGYDQVGHGISDGERAYIPRFDYYVWDLEQIINEYRKEEIPTVLFGHSMGGLVVLSHCIVYRKDFAGVITSGTALQEGKDASGILKFFAPLFGEVFPKMKTTKIGTQDISRDEEIVEQYENDPLVYHDGMKARLGIEMLRRMKKTSKVADLFSQPALFMHGGADRLTNPDGTIHFHDNCSSTDKDLKIWEGCYHELINEPEKEEIMDYMMKWIRRRVKSFAID